MLFFYQQESVSLSPGTRPAGHFALRFTQAFFTLHQEKMSGICPSTAFAKSGRQARLACMLRE
jgi:hypothetical protein